MLLSFIKFDFKVANFYFTIVYAFVVYYLKELETNMNIRPISMQTNFKSQAVSFKGKQEQPKPLIQVTDDMPDDQVVTYGTWGSNYAYPITAGQIRANMAKKAEAARAAEAQNISKQETPEEYYRRKVYSTEWTM